jgi:hypothetical protein
MSNIDNGIRVINRLADRVFAEHAFVNGLDDVADGDECGDDAEDLADIESDGPYRNVAGLAIGDGLAIAR